MIAAQTQDKLVRPIRANIVFDQKPWALPSARMEQAVGLTILVRDEFFGIFALVS